MKIQNDHRLNELNLQKAGNRSTGSSGAFSDILAQAVEETNGQQNGLSEVNPARQVQSPAEAPLTPVWHQVNGLLDTLDQYGQALGNVSLSLRQIEPLVGRMESQARNLGQELAANGDDSLEDLARQTMAQAQAEIIKFKRGDYI